MDSCFPPLAAGLGLHHATGGGHHQHSANKEKKPTSEHRILQDLDLYYIKQIAHNLKELDLEQKIEVEIKMREGTTKLLQACKHQSQSLEAAKSLLTSNERMTAYMAELQRRKRPSSYNGSLPTTNNKAAGGSRARVCLSDLRMPLIWRDTDHFKNKGDYRRFAVFCLARIGTEMYDTSLLCPVDRSLTDLTFPDVLVFNQVPADFSCTLEVYSHMLREDMSMASTRRKIKNTIHTSISRTVGKKLAASLRDELNSGKIGPHFELMASARLTLDDVNDGVRTHDLKLEHSDVRSNGDCLPLFGHFCCRLAAEPECLVKEITSGPVFDVVRDDDNNTLPPAEADTRDATWASLQGFSLNFWRDRKHWLQDSMLPLHSVPINRDTVIKCSKNCDNIIVVNENEGKETTTTFKLKNTDEREQWVRFLAEHAKDHNRWKVAAEKAMEIYTPGSGKQNFGRQARQGSLYDETPLIESVQSTEYVGSQRPRVQDIFGLTPSTSLSSCSSSSSPPPPASGFRERSLSSGTKSRARWPFLK